MYMYTYIEAYLMDGYNEYTTQHLIIHQLGPLPSLLFNVF